MPVFEHSCFSFLFFFKRQQGSYESEIKGARYWPCPLQ